MSQRDYGRKPYLSDKRYPEFIRTTPAKAIWDSVVRVYPNLSEFDSRRGKLSAQEIQIIRYIRQSEFKRPSEPEPYQEMEGDWGGIPGVTVPKGTYTPEQPWNLQIPWDPIATSPAICIFDLESDDEYCPNETHPVTVHGTNPIYWVQVSLTDDPATQIDQGSIEGYGTNTVTFDLIAGDERGPVTIESSMTCFEGLIGASNVNLPETDDCHDFTFTLTRDDGVLVDDTMLVGNFGTYRKNFPGATSNDKEYLGNGKWGVTITGDRDALEEYYVSYSVKTGENVPNIITTQYPFRYKASDKLDPGDEINPGNYSDHVPYFDYLRDWGWMPKAIEDMDDFDGFGNFNAGECGWEYTTGDGTNQPAYIETGIGVYFNISLPMRQEAIIGSSIPYYTTMVSRADCVSRDFRAWGYNPNWTTIPTVFECLNYSDVTGIFGGNCAVWTLATTCPPAGGDPYGDVLGENYTVVEAVSDGHTANSYSPMLSIEPYAESEVLILSPVIGGKTHYFEYSISTSPELWTCHEDEVPITCDEGYGGAITAVGAQLIDSYNSASKRFANILFVAQPDLD